MIGLVATTRRAVAGSWLLIAVFGCASGSTPAATSPASGQTPSRAPATRPPTSTPVAAVTPTAKGSPSATTAAIDPGDVAPEPPLELVWQATDPTGESVPFHPAIDPDGNIWVGAATENRFLVFDRDGQYVETWGTPGSDPGQINFMRGTDSFGGIAFAEDGSFYVSESGNRRVQKFDANREFVTSWGSFGPGEDEFLVPNAIALDGNGNVYVHDDEQSVTKMFTADGEFVRTFAAGSTPFVSVTEDGRVLAQMWETNLLNEYARDGSLRRSIDLDGLVAVPRAAAVVVDERDHIWISSVTEDGPRDVADKLIELDESGTLVHRWDGMAVTQFVIDSETDLLYAAFWGQPYLAAYALPAE